MRYLSVFSGIGGMDIAAERAGFSPLAFVEWDAFKRRVLAKHWPQVPLYGDIKAFCAVEFVGRVDVVAGGPPCPDFSQANKYAKGFDGERGQLVFDFLRVAKESGAAYVLLENSARVVTRFRHEFERAFASFGFNAVPLCLDAGVIHSRKRGFFVANTDKVGGLQELQAIASLVSDFKRDDQAPDAGRTKFILRADADPVFLAEGHGQSLVAPVFCREDDGVPYRLDRVRALGDAVVPAQVLPIWKALATQILRRERVA